MIELKALKLKKTRTNVTKSMSHWEQRNCYHIQLRSSSNGSVTNVLHWLHHHSHGQHRLHWTFLHPQNVFMQVRAAFRNK